MMKTIWKILEVWAELKDAAALARQGQIAEARAILVLDRAIYK